MTDGGEPVDDGLPDGVTPVGVEISVEDAPDGTGMIMTSVT